MGMLTLTRQPPSAPAFVGGCSGAPAALESDPRSVPEQSENGRTVVRWVGVVWLEERRFARKGNRDAVTGVWVSLEEQARAGAARQRLWRCRRGAREASLTM